MFKYKKPLICIPVVAEDEDGINKNIEEIKKSYFDIIEFRIDYLKEYFDINKIKKYARIIKENLNASVILTFRTKMEGGEKEITPSEYEKLLKNLMDEKVDADIIDVEAKIDEDVVKNLIDFAHANGYKIILSNHNFAKTPAENEIISLMHYMDDLGGDIIKTAYMPNDFDDVLRVMSCTKKACDEIDKPIVSMSMSELGMISRINGELFGSYITFGSVMKASAPGQVDALKLKSILDGIDKACK